MAKVLVVYESKFGNTKLVAETISHVRAFWAMALTTVSASLLVVSELISNHIQKTQDIL